MKLYQLQSGSAANKYSSDFVTFYYLKYVSIVNLFVSFVKELYMRHCHKKSDIYSIFIRKKNMYKEL